MTEFGTAYPLVGQGEDVDPKGILELDNRESPESATATVPAGKGKKTRGKYTMHGLHALKGAVRTLGKRGLHLDRRFAVTRALEGWEAAVAADLGGDLSTQQKALLRLAATTKMQLDSIDTFLAQQRSLVNQKKRAVLPVVRERLQLADALARYLTALGLERKAKPVPSLPDYIEGREGA
jgi:hypothetical protein